MMEDEILPCIIAVVLIMLLTFGGAFWLSSAACSGKAVSFDSHDWGPVKGCMVLHNGRWLPIENIRGFDDK